MDQNLMHFIRSTCKVEEFSCMFHFTSDKSPFALLLNGFGLKLSLAQKDLQLYLLLTIILYCLFVYLLFNVLLK